MPVATPGLPIQGFDDHDAISLEETHCPNLRNVRSDRSRIVQAPGGTLLAPPPPPSAGFGMMTGTFTIPLVTGSQTITHNLGATPKALIVFLSGPGHNTGSDTNYHWTMGMTDGTTSRNCSMAASKDSKPTTARRYDNVLLTVTDSNGAILSEAFLAAWTSTTMTLTWLSVDGGARIVNYCIWGHTALSATVLEWNTGTTPGAVAVTGAGFDMTASASVLISIYADLTSVGGGSANAKFGYSMTANTGASPTSAFACGVSSQNGAMGRNGIVYSTGVYGRTADFLLMPTVTAPNDTDQRAAQFSANIASFDANGFTATLLTAPPVGTLVATLCMTGFSSTSCPTITSPVTMVPSRVSVTGVGFQPTGAFYCFAGIFPGSQGFQMFEGAYDGNNQNAIGIDDDVQNDAVAHAFVRNGNFEVGRDRLYNVVSLDSDGLTFNVYQGNFAQAFPLFLFALPGSPQIIRNYGDLIVGGSTPTEAIVMLTQTTAFVYSPSTPLTGVWGATAEVYTGNQFQRFSIANGTDSRYGAVAAWSQGKDNIRFFDGVTPFGALIAVGTNCAARSLVSFNNRIVAARPFFGGIDHKTQIRWSVNGDYGDWSSTGSGALEIVETSNQPLTAMFVNGNRCFISRAREMIELIATGSLSPVFIPEPRVPGVGFIATHSVASGDIYTFGLGPDEVYRFDGSQMIAVGGRAYNTITQLIGPNYENLDIVQATVYEPDSQYWLVIPPYIFIYDYRRDIWDWDDARAFEAIGRLYIQDLVTGNINHSEFVVIGDASANTIRIDPSTNTYLGTAIDSYFETKDFIAFALGGRSGTTVSVSYDRYNSCWRFWFRGTPGQTYEIGISVDKGLTYPVLQLVTVNAAGVGIAFFDVPYNVVRFRVRSQPNFSYLVQGPLQYEWTETGIMLPP